MGTRIKLKAHWVVREELFTKKKIFNFMSATHKSVHGIHIMNLLEQFTFGTGKKEFISEWGKTLLMSDISSK